MSCKEEVKAEEIRAYEKLNRFEELYPEFNSVNKILSHYPIISGGEDKFIQNFSDDLDGGSREAREIYRTAADISEKAALIWANIKDVIAPYYSQVIFNNLPDNFLNKLRSIPAYDRLFGSLDYINCDHCRSIFGPAAYFVDLMSFVQTYITDANQIPEDCTLDYRRPDLAKIRLDCSNSTDIIPSIDLVNELLEAFLETTHFKETKIQVDAYELAKDAIFPQSLPFNSPHKEIQGYLNGYETSLWQIYQAFNRPFIDDPFENKLDGHIAREFLQLSPEDSGLIKSEISSQDISGYFGGVDLTGIDGLENVDVLLEQMKLTREELNELIYQNLDRHEVNAGLSRLFFINSADDGLGALAISNQEGTGYDKLLNLSPAKLDRMYRFLKLSRKLNWSFADLDCSIRSLYRPYLPERVLKFDGIDDYISCRNASKLDLLSLPEFTIEAWISPESSANNAALGLLISRDDVQHLLYLGLNPDGKLEFYIFRMPGDNGQETRKIIFEMESYYDSIANGIFTHVAVTYANEKFCLFINGKKVLIDENDESEKPFIRPALSSPISCIEMGLGRDLFDKYFHGCIKEVRIWNKAHDEAALQENIYQRFTGKERDLIGYWPLAEGLWDYLPDMTPAGSNGVLGGGEFSAQPEWVYRELILDPLSVAEGASLLRFNGVDQYLAVDGFELAETDQITIEAEIEIEERLGAARQDDCILCLGENGQNAEIVLYSSAQGNLVFQFGSAPTVVKSKDSSPPTLPLGQKIHVCVAFKTTDTVNNNGEVKIYINGKETETDPIDIPSATFKIEHGLLNVGRNFSGETGEYYFIGMIRELRLWGRERTNEQINSYLYRKVPSSSPGLVGYWRLDDVEEGKARDLSGNENDLCLGGILSDYSPLPSPTEILPLRADLPVPAAGTVLQFDGDNDVIVIKNPENRGLGRYERITIELWFNVASPIDAGRKQVLFSQGDGEAGLCIYLYHGLLHILEWNNTLENAAQNIPPQIKSLFKILFTDNGKWHHIAITQNEFPNAIPDEASLPLDNCFYRKDDFELRAYLDAVPILNESQSEVSTGYKLCPVGPIYLGGLGKQGKTCFDDAYSDLDHIYFFAGQIASLGIWRIVKSRDEIDYGRYFAPSVTEDLITYLPMMPANEEEEWYIEGWEEENRHKGTLQERNIGLVCSQLDPELVNIYSHYYPGQDALSWSNYCYSGRVQIKDGNAAIGITFYSRHIEDVGVAGSGMMGIDQCYLLGRDANQKTFHLFAHPSGVQKVKSSNSSVDMRMTDINPQLNVWYNFLVVVESTSTQINIKAKIWPESEAMPVAFQIDAYDDSGIHITSGTVGVWTTGSFATPRQFDNLSVWPSSIANPLPSDLLLDINFEAESQVPEPSNWLDGEDRQKLALPGGLFKQINVQGGAPGETAFGTNSEDLNIHSYFSSPDKGELLWNNYLYSGRMRISHADGCIGVVFFSRQAEGIDQYYRLFRDAQHPTFRITAHPRDVQMVKSFDPSIDKRDSGISPLPNVWYNYLIEVYDTGTATRIRGKIWPESGTAPLAYSIDAIDDSDIRIKSGGAGVWASAAGSKYFGQLKVQLNSIYNENFESYSADQDPANWRDTNRNNFEDNSLFKTYTLDGKTVFGTKYMPSQQWAQLPIHTHYIGSGVQDWKNYIFAGCFRIGDPSDMMFGGISVTVLSQYFPGSQSTRYYKLTAIPNQSFIMLLNESNAALKGIYTANLDPQVNTWYRFIIEVEDTGSCTNIKAKVWPESQTEPSTYQINAYNDASTRLKSGTVGFLTTGHGSKYFKDLGVFARQHSLDSSIPERWHDLTMRTSKKGAEVDDLFKTVDLLDNTPHWISLPSDTYNYNYPVLLHPLSRASLEFDGKRKYLAANGYRGFTPGQLSLEAWVRPSEIKESSIIRMSGKDSEERDMVIAFGMDGSGKLELSQKAGGVVTLLASSQAIVLDTSKFYHVALSTTDGGLAFFVDGNVVASDFQTLGLLNSSGLDIKRVDIGRGMDDCHVSGKIKEVRIWNTSRSQDEIRLSMYQKAYPSDDLLGYWSLGEEDGLLDIDHSARQNDMRKGGLDEDRCPALTEIKALGFWRPSRKALSFNGTSHLIKYEYDRPSEVVSRCTIELWFLVEDKNISQQKQVIYQEGDDQCGLSIYVCDGSLYVGGYNLLCGWEGTWLYSDRIESGRWHHAALVLDGRGEVRDEALQVYLDGKLMVCGSASQISGKKVSFALGGLRSPIRFHDDPDHSYGGSSGQLFCGQILSLRIWNSARTPEQIRDNLYLEPVDTNNSLPGLDLWWESDVLDPLGCIITDLSGNDRNGTYAEQQQQTIRLPAKYELPSLSINEEVLEGIAVIKLLMERSSLAIDRLTSLWYVLKHSGYDNSTPLFDKIFNPKGTVMPPWDYYLDEPMRWDKSGRGSSDSRIRSRLMGAMHLSDSDLNLIVEYLSGKDELIIEIDNNYLTQMYQLSQLAKLLSLSVADLLDLLPMEGGRPDSLLDILRISNTAEWLNTSGLSVADLVCFARPISDPKSAIISRYTEDDIRSQADTIFRQFASFAINAKTFQSDHISEALSGDIFDFLNPGIVTDFGAVAQAYSIETDLSQMPPELAETEDWMTEFEVLKAEFDQIRTGLGDEIFGRHEIKAENGTITQTKITGRLDSHGFITEWGLVLDKGDYSPESILAIFDGQTPAKAVQDLLPKVTEKLMERKVIQNMLISPDGPVRTALESSLEGIDNILESELANLFDVKKEMISSILGSLGDEGVDGLLAELNDLLPTEEQPKPVISEELLKKFFKMSKLVYLAGSFELTAEETALLIAHPEHYSVSDLLAPTILDLYNLYCYKQLQEAFGDTEGLLDAVLAMPLPYYPEDPNDEKALKAFKEATNPINDAMFDLTGWERQQIAELVDCLKASSYNT
ncbi:MAG: Tc toxin subunit A, partial [Methanothrix sp.]|nr:Tc toxin subunit A [Methanothrix sp.]